MYLATTNTLRAKAGTATAVTFTVFGDEVASGVDAFSPIAQGQLASTTTTIYTAPASTQTIITEIQLANTTASDVTGVTFYLNGAASSNQINAGFTIPASGSATYRKDNGWTIYSAVGIPISTVTITLTGDVTGSGTGSIATTIGANAVTDAKFRQGAARTVVGVTGNATANTADIQGGADQVLRVNGAGTALAFGAIDLSKTAAATGVLQAASFPAQTGDVTNTAGSLSNSIKNDVALAGNPTTTTQSQANNSTRIATTAYVDTLGATKVPSTRTLTTTAPLTGGGDLSADRTFAVSDATFTTRGILTATEKIALNSLDGRTSTGTNPRVFRPGDYMQGNVHDPTGASISTSFAAMMTAARAWNDRYEIELAAGVWKIPHDTLKDFGTNNTSVTIRGPGRGNCILLPSAAPTGFQSMIAPNRNTTGGDSITMRGFTIYNTSGTVYTTGAGILTNGADGIDIQEVAFIDMYRDIQVSGEPHTMTTNGTTALTGITPAISAADTGQTISGPGIVPGSTITFLTSSTATLSVAATTSTSEVRYLNNSIKVSIQHIANFNTNAGAANTSVAIYVNNGQAGDTYIGPDVVMSDGGGSTRRRACIELVETGHYEITQANLTGSQYGILMDPGASQSVAFGFHTNVLCDSNQINGMLLDTLATTSSIKNIKSVNSWYSGTVNAAAPFNVGAAGVKTQATTAGTLNGFTHTTDRFLNNRTHGYEHAAGTDFRWSDCDMKGNSQIGSNTADGLNVAANIGNWSINGGKFGGGDASPTSGNQRYGINVAAGTGDNIKVGPDSLTGNVTGPLLFAATGLNNFINGCPGLYTGFTRGATTTTVAATAKTVGSTFVPKGSLSVRSAWRVTVTYQHIGIGTVPTISVRFGTTNDVVDTTATNAIIGSLVAASGAANVWGQAYFMLEINQTGAGTGIIGAGGFLVQAALVTAFATAARANGAGMLNNINTTVDNYLTVSATTTATAGLTILGATIEPVAF